jgi:hypothetical protein
MLNARAQVWLVGDGLTDGEQRRAQAGAHLVPYSQFPPDAIRKDCVYHSTPALQVPDAFENLHACEVFTGLNWLRWLGHCVHANLLVVRTGCRGG